MSLPKLVVLVTLWSWAMGAYAACCPKQQAKDNGCVEVVGKASYAHADKAYARQMAIRDALQLAVLQWGSQVRSRQKVDKFQLTESQLTVHAKGQIRGFTILAEEDNPEDKLYSARLKVCLQPLKDACPSPFVSGLKPRLALGQLLINQPYAVRDIRDLPQGFIKALMRTLKQTYGNVVYTDQATPLLNESAPAPQLEQGVLQHVQEETGAQFVLLMALRDADLRRKPDFTGLSSVDQMLEEGRRFYSDEQHPNRRSLTLDWYLVDVNHFKVLVQGQLKEEIAGEVYVGRDKPFDTVAFYQTPTGQAFERLIKKLQEEVVKRVRCAPFEARILEVNTMQDTQEIIFFATPESGLRVGDQLTLYHMDGNPIRMGTQVLGRRTSPVGFVRIKLLQDQFAIGEVVAKNGRVEVNDWVKSW